MKHAKNTLQADAPLAEKRLVRASHLLLVIMAAMAAVPVYAVTTTWTGNGDWHNTPANWSAGVPANGDDAVIASGSVLLTSNTAALGSLTNNGGTFTFTNWDTKLTATNVTLNGGSLTLPAAFTNNAMSNNVYIACSTLTINTGGVINADSRGYAGAPLAGPRTGNGPGGGQQTSGGSYGGRGSDYSVSAGLAFRAGDTYGSLSAPIYPGSGGGSDGSATDGGHGGGAVRIDASGHVLVNGTISANGQTTSRGGGSGGGIYITCNTFGGTNGVIRANGGNGFDGGGGRIAVIYSTNAQAPLLKPTVVFSANHGTNIPWWLPSDLGTLYFPDNAFLDPALVPHSGRWLVPGATNLAVDTLVVSNANIRFSADGFRLTVTNDLVITGNGKLELGGDFNDTNLAIGFEHFIHTRTNGPQVSIGRNLILTNSGSLKVYAGMTNGSSPSNGASVNVTSNIFISSNCWIYPHSHPTNGGSVLFNVDNLYIMSSTNGGINANYRGYRRGLPYTPDATGYGPGRARGPYSGGGYGGSGGWYSVEARAGLPYGDSNAPAQAGSSGYGDAGATYIGGDGGGLIRIEAAGTISVKGQMLARGQNPYVNAYGSGAGGGIYLRCRTFAGDANGQLIADGGSGAGTAGGGGRIAVWRMYDTSGGAVTSTANKGSGGANPATDGTVVWGQLPVPGTVFTIH